MKTELNTHNAQANRRIAIAQCKADITHTCDGPVTQFVMIARAVDLAAFDKYDQSTVANALYELLNLAD